MQKLGLNCDEGCYSKLSGKLLKYISKYFASLQAIEILWFTVLTDLTSTLTILLGSIAVALAIAFGFGGRDLVTKKIEEVDKCMKEKDENIEG